MAEGSIHKKDEIGFSDLLKKFENKLEEDVGAIGSFIGIVRGKAKTGAKLKKIQYESAENADKELKKAAASIEKDIEGISKISIHHIIDDLHPGDEIIYVLVGGEHRKEVFEALPQVMEQIKSEVRIWKKEITNSEEYWIHEKEKE